MSQPRPIIETEPDAPREFFRVETTAQLQERVHRQIEKAMGLCNNAAARRYYKQVEIYELLSHLRDATCAAQELANRAGGSDPVRVRP